MVYCYFIFCYDMFFVLLSIIVDEIVSSCRSMCQLSNKMMSRCNHCVTVILPLYLRVLSNHCVSLTFSFLLLICHLNHHVICHFQICYNFRYIKSLHTNNIVSYYYPFIAYYHNVRVPLSYCLVFVPFMPILFCISCNIVLPTYLVLVIGRYQNSALNTNQ